MNGYDAVFWRDCEKIFEVDTRFPGLESNRVREWINIAVSDIVSLYTVNPTTLYGTLNIGPNVYKDYYDQVLEKGITELYSDRQIDDFITAYKTFGVYTYQVMGDRLVSLVNRAIDEGYSDIACSLNRFRPGALILNVRAISPFPETPY